MNDTVKNSVLEKDSRLSVPELRRLGMPMPRSGVDAAAKLALRQYLCDHDRDLAGAFRRGVATASLIRSRSEAVAVVLTYLWRALVGDWPAATLFAVGGFGRYELFPESDVDLLVVAARDADHKVFRGIEAFFTALWDLGLKPGHAVRDLDATREMWRHDISVYTSLLDARFIAGDPEQAEALLDALPDAAYWTPSRFLEGKRKEQQARHKRYGGTAYNLEPNIKESPGGLRDLQLVDWLTQIMAGRLQPVAADGLIDEGGQAALESAQADLYRIRYALHLLAKRPEERLVFDHQRALATELNYDDGEGNLAVEQFMQMYFRAASRIAAINDDVLSRCAEALAPQAALPISLGEGILQIGDAIEFDDFDVPSRKPEAVIRLFSIVASNPDVIGLRAAAKRAVRQAMADPDVDVERPEVFAAFRDLLEGPTDAAVAAIDGLAKHGFLARLIPAFAQVSGRMQYDLFHVYTVDEHTLRVLSFMARFASDDGAADYPLPHNLFPRLSQPSLLLLAGLFHDIAKGRGGDHSLLGEEDARKFCRQLDLPESDVELVAWLVRSHLLMSTTAQRQDISDPDVVRRFAAGVADWERLTYLYLLTVADINGTSPKLWNSWRDRLLSDLYTATRFELRETRSELPLASDRARVCRDKARALLNARGIGEETIDRIWSEFAERSFLRYRAEQIAWQTEAIAKAVDLPLVRIRPVGPRGATEIFIYTGDRHGLFATVTAMLDRLQMNVLDARIVTSKLGRALNTFFVLDSEGRTVTDPDLISEAEIRIADALKNPPPQGVRTRRVMSRAQRHFTMSPRISFRTDASGTRTRLALVCSDRPGLLAAVAHALRLCLITVHDARIATIGERVEDFFELTDDDGRLLDEATEAKLRDTLIEQIEAESFDSLLSPPASSNSAVL